MSISRTVHESRSTREPVAPAFVVAHTDYAWSGDVRDPGRPALSARPGIRHAVLIDAPGPGSTLFQDYAAGDAWRALCGTEVLVVTPSFFDDAAGSACRRCGIVLNRWLDDRDAIHWELRVPTSAASR